MRSTPVLTRNVTPPIMTSISLLLIARYLAKRYAKEYGRDIDPNKAFAASAHHAMMKFAWPGNIRQLENHIKKALVLAEGPQITAKDLTSRRPRARRTTSS